MSTIIDLVARRAAAKEAERERFEEWLNEERLEDAQDRLRFEHERRIEWERNQRLKYQAAMAEKRTREAKALHRRN